MPIIDKVKVRRALLSVSDKRGIENIARRLADLGIEIISTGGTFKTLTDAGVSIMSVSEVTGFPEILDGRVKTLHPAIHAGLLARHDNPLHLQQLREQKIRPIELVIVNLYPFEQTIAREDVTFGDAIEQIDIGGPAMLRAAAKNHAFTAVIVNPKDYESVVDELQKNDNTLSLATRTRLARVAFEHTSAYDTAIAEYLSRSQSQTDEPPERLIISLERAQVLRYGENPHQKGALYGAFGRYFRQLHGKELSFNNILDIHAAAKICAEFSQPTAVIVKHNNPCGVGSAAALLDAFKKALATDSRSAFGGIVCFNRPLDAETAMALNEIFTEVIIAPVIPDDVLALLKKKKDRRLMQQLRTLPVEGGVDVRIVAGGYLAQHSDEKKIAPEQFHPVTKRKPTTEEVHAMLFAWRVAKHVKSNAIVYARADRTLGIGAGQMSRFDSSRIAVMKAQDAGLDLTGCAVASDAFFPFADGLLEAVKVGATAVVQPGGSVRDEEVIKAADENNVAMVFTGVRHFRH